MRTQFLKGQPGKLDEVNRPLTLILLCQIKILASDHVGKYNVMC
jgi:hypothetical protein